MYFFEKVPAFLLLAIWIQIHLSAAAPIKRVVPTISNEAELQSSLPDFLDHTKKMVVLLDYDGTLTPLTVPPQGRNLTPEIEKILRELANNSNIFLSVITGRSITDIKTKVQIPDVTFSGNHGFEIEYPDGSRGDFEVPESIKNSYPKLLKELEEKVGKHKAWVEDKKVSLTFHYNETPEEYIEELRKESVRIIESYGWRASSAHLAVEGKPPVDWHKGEAAKRILQTKFGNDWAENTRVIFIGDDTTDEDAMKSLQGIGKSFRISSDPDFETYADFRLPTLNVTPTILKWILNFYA